MDVINNLIILVEISINNLIVSLTYLRTML